MEKGVSILLKIKCPVCDEHKSTNAYYRMTIHENKYHELREKIHEKIEYLLKNNPKIQDETVTMNLHEIVDFSVLQELKSLLDDKK